MQHVFNDPEIEEITIEELNRYPVIRYGTPDGFSIDLIAIIETIIECKPGIRGGRLCVAGTGVIDLLIRRLSASD